MKFFLIVLVFLNFSYSKEFETNINNFFIDWDNAHNNKNIGLFDKLYSENVNYYNSKNFSKFQIIDDKVRILKKNPEFKQSSKIISKEEVSNQLVKINYEKNTFYANKNRTYNSYLVLSTANNEIKIIEENDIKNNNSANSTEKVQSKELNISRHEIEKFEEKDKSEIKNWKIPEITSDEMEKIRKLIEKDNSEIKDWENLYKNYPNLYITNWIDKGITNPLEIKAWLDTNIFDSKNNTSFQVYTLKKLGIKTPEELKEWFIVAKDYYKITNYKEWNVTITEAIKWEKLNIPHYKLKEIVNLNIPPDELKDLSPTILDGRAIRILKDLNMKSSPLIESMNSVFGLTLILTKESFIKYYNILIDNKCGRIEKLNFSNSDEYDNEGLCYYFEGKLIQRLNKNEGLMSASYNTGTNSYVYFDDSWRENAISNGIIKGMGNVEYTTIMNKQQLIRKGKVLFFFNRDH
jgi:hypothetical protein